MSLLEKNHKKLQSGKLILEKILPWSKSSNQYETTLVSLSHKYIQIISEYFKYCQTLYKHII